MLKEVCDSAAKNPSQQAKVQPLKDSNKIESSTKTIKTEPAINPVMTEPPIQSSVQPEKTVTSIQPIKSSVQPVKTVPSIQPIKTESPIILTKVEAFREAIKDVSINTPADKTNVVVTVQANGMRSSEMFANRSYQNQSKQPTAQSHQTINHSNGQGFKENQHVQQKPSEDLRAYLDQKRSEQNQHKPPAAETHQTTNHSNGQGVQSKQHIQQQPVTDLRAILDQKRVDTVSSIKKPAVASRPVTYVSCKPTGTYPQPSVRPAVLPGARSTIHDRLKIQSEVVDFNDAVAVLARYAAQKGWAEPEYLITGVASTGRMQCRVMVSSYNYKKKRIFSIVIEQ